MTSTLSSLTSAQLNLGCFSLGMSLTSQGGQGSSNTPILSGLSPYYRDIYMSRGACTLYCKNGQFLYAITEEGSTCYCSNNRPAKSRQVRDSLCDRPCVGFPFEMCGSSVVVTGPGGGAYANVILVRSMLIEGILDKRPGASLQPRKDSEEEDTQSQEQEENEQDREQGSTTKANHSPAQKQDSDKSDSSKEERRRDGDERNKEEGETEEDDDEDEDRSEEDEEEEEEEEEGKDTSKGQARSGHSGQGSSTSSSGSRIPVASTVVVVVCLIGICAFFVYLGRRRKRERTRDTWINSVFGAGMVPKNARKGAHSPGSDDMDSISDAQSEAMDRRQSLISAARRGSTAPGRLYSNTNRTSIMLPEPVHRAKYGSSQPLPLPPFRRTSTQLGFQGGYKEYIEEDVYEDVEVMSSTDGYLTPEPLPMPAGNEGRPNRVSSMAHVQRPSGVAYGMNHGVSPRQSLPPFPLDRHLYQYQHEHQHQRQQQYHPHGHQHYPPKDPFEYTSENEDPFQDPSQHSHAYRTLHGQSQNRRLTMGALPSITPALDAPWSGPAAHQRPHSYAFGYCNRSADEEEEYEYGSEGRERQNSFRTHVLEETDGESLEGEEEHGTRAAGGKAGKGLKHHLKRLSQPYVHAIRQQQQGQAYGDSWLSRIGREDKDGARLFCEEELKRQRKNGYGHEQVHSGSLASFRGLDDPSHPRLRVTNPDDSVTSLTRL